MRVKKKKGQRQKLDQSQEPKINGSFNRNVLAKSLLLNGKILLVNLKL